jgi:hypothetical protein
VRSRFRRQPFDVAELGQHRPRVRRIVQLDRGRLELLLDVGDGVVCGFLRLADVDDVPAPAAHAERGARELHVGGLATFTRPHAEERPRRGAVIDSPDVFPELNVVRRHRVVDAELGKSSANHSRQPSGATRSASARTTCTPTVDC